MNPTQWNPRVVEVSLENYWCKGYQYRPNVFSHSNVLKFSCIYINEGSDNIKSNGDPGEHLVSTPYPDVHISRVYHSDQVVRIEGLDSSGPSETIESTI